VFTLDAVSTFQTPLPGTEAALIGLLALAVVMVQVLWPFAEHLNVMAHEGAHAVTGSVLGFPVHGIELQRDATGGTAFRMATTGARGVLTGFVGYLGPSAFGLGAAKLISVGHSIAVLWLTVVFLVLLLVRLTPPSFGYVTVPAALVLLYLVLRYGSVGFEVVTAYGITWLLLLSGVRVAFQDGAMAGDARNLRDRTHLPRVIWAFLWIAGTIGAAYIGVRLLVMRP
jgi:Peptidase M50B-like